jgi:hypothetical protein
MYNIRSHATSLLISLSPGLYWGGGDAPPEPETDRITTAMQASQEGLRELSRQAGEADYPNELIQNSGDQGTGLSPVNPGRSGSSTAIFGEEV